MYHTHHRDISQLLYNECFLAGHADWLHLNTNLIAQCHKTELGHLCVQISLQMMHLNKADESEIYWIRNS